MSVFAQASTLLSSPQGSLVYHLLLLWAVWFSLGMAWGEWRRARQEPAQQLLLVVAGLMVLRLAYAVAVLLASAGWVQQAVVLPPLERYADAASIGLLAWGFMPPDRQRARLWDGVLGAVLLLLTLGCVVLAVLWGQTLAANPAAHYNSNWQSSTWTAVQLGLLLLAALALIRSKTEGWGILIVALLLMLAGTLAQSILYLTVPHLPVWQRLANLVAYPLLAVGIYQHIIAGLRVHSLELQDISQASLDEIKSLLYLFEVSRQTSSSLDMPTVLDNAVRGIARVLDADQCAIAFPEEGNAGQMRLVAIYNPTRQGRGEAVAFPLEYQLTVQQAIRRRKHIIVEESENVQLKVLFALLGSGETGPVLVQPLLGLSKDTIGAIIVGNSRSRRPFTANEAKLCQSMAEQVVTAIENARQYQALQRSLQELNKTQAEERRTAQQARAQLQELGDRLQKNQAAIEDLTQREAAAREARNALEIRLVSSRAEADSLAERLGILESDLAQTHANAEARLHWHEAEAERQQAEWDETIRAAESLMSVMQGLTAGILVTDARGVIQEANVAAEILLDRSSDELQGLSLEMVSDEQRWRQAVATASGGEAVRLTLGIGSNTLMCDVAPLPDPQSAADDVQKMVVILQDVSSEVEGQRNRAEAIAVLSEELRTPVTTILSYADLLLGETVGLLGDAQRKFVLQIKAGAQRIIKLAGELAREAGDEEHWSGPRQEALDINQLIEAAIAGSQARLEDKALTLDLHLMQDLPTVNADPDYLRRILNNLLSNACLASGLGGHIEVQTAQSLTAPLKTKDWVPNGDGFVIVSVKDSGGGLSEEGLSRVFDRGRPSQVPSGLGESGAGLSLVKTLIEAHGGRLWVESDRGTGTTFSFVLPVGGNNSGDADGHTG